MPQREIGISLEKQVLVLSVRVQWERGIPSEGDVYVCDTDVTLCNYGNQLRSFFRAFYFCV